MCIAKEVAEDICNNIWSITHEWDQHNSRKVSAKIEMACLCAIKVVIMIIASSLATCDSYYILNQS